MSNLELWREDVEIFFQCCKIDLIPRFGIFNSTISNGEWETRLLTFLLLLGLIYRFQDRLNNVLIVVSDAWNRYRPRQQAEMIGETRISSKKSGRCRARFVSSHRSKKKWKQELFFSDEGMKHQIETTSSSHCLICSHVSYVLLVYIHSIGPHELVAIARDIFIHVLKHILRKKKESNFNISKIKDDQQQPLRGAASAFSPKLSRMKSKANATSCFSADRKLMIILPTFSIYFSYE